MKLIAFNRGKAISAHDVESRPRLEHPLGCGLKCQPGLSRGLEGLASR